MSLARLCLILRAGINRYSHANVLLLSDLRLSPMHLFEGHISSRSAGIGPFRVGIAPSDVPTAQHGHRPALYPPLLHAGKRDPFFCVWVEAFGEGGLVPYQVQAAVQRHRTLQGATARQ